MAGTQSSGCLEQQNLLSADAEQPTWNSFSCSAFTARCPSHPSTTSEMLVLLAPWLSMTTLMPSSLSTSKVCGGSRGGEGAGGWAGRVMQVPPHAQPEKRV